jgi:valyl-tRNA synthetase
MMSKEMAKTYEPKQVEQRLYQYWVDEGLFHAEVNAEQEPFCIVIPPPNVTGVLHMGHALDVSIQDLLTRWHRMLGHAALWLPGSDHASIATHAVVEARLAEKGLTRYDLGRDQFIEEVWKVTKEHQSHIREQLKRCGASLDWSRERFTMDADYSRAVREAFVRLYEEGLIYRGERMINWCPRCGTSLSDLEVEHVETDGHLWHIRYPGKNGGPGVVVATTRPETMLGDTAVTVHPDDERYEGLIGASVVLPLMEREIPVIADEYVDVEFGTGALKVTPAHDPNDLEIAERHGLPSVTVIGPDGKMTEEAGAYAGMDRAEAREAVVAELEQRGLLECVEEYRHTVGHCSRCHTTVEPLVSLQWFVRMESLAELGLQAVRDGEVGFVPERWASVYCDWLEDFRDWCISRQLWWGHPVPVWYCDDCGEVTCTREDPTECAHCGSRSLTPDPDVLDTWFSSALWPFATLGWPDETAELEYFYPTSVLVTGYDIIYFWVARMVMMGKQIRNERPFESVFIHGLVRDSDGRKISKSLGNNIDPIDLIEEYGADAVRFALVQLITHGQDLKYSEDRILAARNFGNKLWNAARFVMMNLDDEDETVEPVEAELSLADRWILSRHAATMEVVNKELSRYNLAQAADALYEHTWGEFCDWYLELCKPDLYGSASGQRKATVLSVLRQMLSGILRALHPFMPFVTEEVWHGLVGDSHSISVAEYPQADGSMVDADAEAQMSMMQSVVSTVRNLRSVVAIPPSQKVEVTLQGDADTVEMLREQRAGIAALAGVERLSVEAEVAESPGSALGDVADGVRVFLHIGEGIDLNAELTRLGKQMAELEKLNAQCRRKLDNENFVRNAPAEVVELERMRVQENTANLEKLQAQAELVKASL